MAIVTRREVDAQRAMSAAAAIPFAGVLGAALAGGVAGGISAEVARETSKPLNDDVAAEKYSYATSLRNELVNALKADGYDVATASLEHKPGRFAEKLDALGGQSDLVLDIVASATCSDVDAGKSPHFRPVVRARVKLTRPGDPSPIMDKDFLYDDALAKPDAFQIKGDPRYDIADYAALKANIKGCLQGIKASVPALANAIISAFAAQKSQVAAN